MYTPSPFVSLVTLAGRSGLYDHRTGALHELNDTARGLWEGLAEGLGRDDLARELAEAGLSRRQAAEFVGLALGGWFQAGFLVPDEVLRRLGEAADSDRNVRLGAVRVGLRIFGAPAAAEAQAVFGHLYDDGPAEEAHLAIVQSPDGCFVFADGRPVGERGAGGFAPWIKARLTDHYLRRVSGGFLGHGALLERAGKRLFIAGKPGAGKSTLAAALALSGFRCLGDDIVEVRGDAVFQAAPFALALKSGSWPLLEALGADISRLPAYSRGDGQTVRYLAAAEASPPAPLDLFLRLDRQEGAPASLAALAPMDALCVLLDGAASSDGQIEPALLAAVGRALERAAAYTLTYSSLPDAVRLLERTVGELP